MLIGVYFTIKYRPYCTLKNSESELARELHLKQLLGEPMSENAQLQLNRYLLQTNIYVFGQFLIFISVIPHILISIDKFNALSFPPYFLILICTLPVIVIRPFMLPFCYRTFPSSILWKYTDEYVEKLKIYNKKRVGKELTTTELKIYRNEEFSHKMFFLYRNVSNFGVVLHLLLDVFFVLTKGIVVN